MNCGARARAATSFARATRDARDGCRRLDAGAGEEGNSLMLDVIELLDQFHDCAEVVAFGLSNRSETGEREKDETEDDSFLHGLVFLVTQTVSLRGALFGDEGHATNSLCYD